MENNKNHVTGDGNANVAGDGNRIGVLQERQEKFISRVEKVEKSIEKLDNRLSSEIRDLQRQKFSKKHKNLILLATALLFGLSTIAICLSLSVFSIDSTAFLGWTVAVLSMAVVVLMGWQIFNVLDLKEYRDALRKIDVLKESVEQLKKEVYTSIKENTEGATEPEQKSRAEYSFSDVEGYALAKKIRLTKQKKKRIDYALKEVCLFCDYPVYFAPDKKGRDWEVYPDEALKIAFKMVFNKNYRPPWRD
jgi:cation transport ATPase